LRVQNLFEVGKILDGLMRGREFEQPIDRLKDFRRAARQRLGDFERDVRSMLVSPIVSANIASAFATVLAFFEALAASVAILEVVSV
jgi:hypothetical protein